MPILPSQYKVVSVIALAVFACQVRRRPDQLAARGDCGALRVRGAPQARARHPGRLHALRRRRGGRAAAQAGLRRPRGPPPPILQIHTAGRGPIEYIFVFFPWPFVIKDNAQIFYSYT